MIPVQKQRPQLVLLVSIMIASRGPVPAVFEPYLSTQGIITQPAATLSVACLAYGTYLTLFLTSLFVLTQRRRNSCPSASSLYSPKVHLTQTILLFVVTTIADGIYAVETGREMLISFDVFKNASYDEYRERMRGGGSRVVIQVVFIVSAVILNTTVDLILISRCYSIWNKSKRVAVPLIVVSAIVNLIGITAIPFIGLDSSSWPHPSKWNEQAATPLIMTFFMANLIFNLMLTLLTAGRIWWIGREAELLLGPAVYKRYNTVIAIILESGIIYPLAQLLNVVFSFAYQPPHMPFNPLPIVITAAGIAPTLVTVRVALGQSVESVEAMEVETSIRFEEAGSHVRSTVDSSRPVELTLNEEKNIGSSRGRTSQATRSA
ncbi:hypothetical protein PM082_019990 [Marasmius tenuissimus]|nr:hypothetical protein PM082_019990 [Marasmius tenuissimus]